MPTDQKGFVPIIFIIAIVILGGTGIYLEQKGIIKNPFPKVTTSPSSESSQVTKITPSPTPFLQKSTFATPTQSAKTSAATPTPTTSPSSSTNNSINNASTPTSTPIPTPTPTPAQTSGYSVKVNSPNGGETFTNGGQMTINWEANNVGTFYLYLIDQNNTAQVITTDYSSNLSGPTTRSFTWTINLPNNSSTQFKIRIAAYQLGGSGFAEDYSDNYFTVSR